MNDLQENRQASRTSDAAPLSPGFVYRVLVIYGIGVLFLLLIMMAWYSSRVLLLVFASILVAVLLFHASEMLRRWLHLGHGTALALVLVLGVAALGMGGWFLAPRVVVQTNQLLVDIPASIQRLQTYLESFSVFRELLRHVPSPDQLIANASAMLARVGLLFSGVLGALGSFAVILFVGIYLAIQPHVYINGLIKLLPKHKRPRAREVFSELSETLGLWLLGKLLSMVIIGVTTAASLYLLDVPLALVLGLVAGLLDFIPYIGPILAAVPAVLIAFSQSPMLALYVVLVFIGMQVLESYLVLPLVERKMVSLPPALTITMQLLVGLPFGLVGIALATPLTATLAVLIAMLYVQDVLGDQVTLPGNHS